MRPQPFISRGAILCLVFTLQVLHGTFTATPCLGTDIYAQRISGGGAGEWVPNGTPVAVAHGDQVYPVLASDGAGGAIVAWYDYRDPATDADIYVQRIDAWGALQWFPTGVPSCRARNFQTMPAIVSDGVGGAIVAWYDNRHAYVSTYDSASVYAQRIDATGTVKWTSDGIAVCDSVGITSYPKIVSGAAGGAIVAWSQVRGSGVDRVEGIYAQWIDTAGVARWAPSGVPLCRDFGNRCCEAAVSDGADGVIVVWRDDRKGDEDHDIYVQHVLATGEVDPAWPPCGRAICDLPGHQDFPAVALDGARGAIVAWQDWRGGNADIYAQRVLASGVIDPGWPAGGRAICAAPDDQERPVILADGVGGAVIGWRDGRGADYDIYAQRVNGAGAPLWTECGLPICAAPGNQPAQPTDVPAIVAQGDSVFFFVWSDSRDGIDDIYAQKVTAAGETLWTENGVAVSTAPEAQNFPKAVLSETGDVITGWTDGREGGGPTPALVSLISADARPSLVRVTWYVSGAPQAFALERRAGEEPWTERGVVSADGTGRIVIEDREVIPGKRHGYRLSLRSRGRNSNFGEVWVVVPAAASFALHGGRPNPVLGRLTVSFSLAGSERATIELVDLAGRRLLSRDVTALGAGNHVLELTDASALAPGLYLLRLSQAGHTAYTKVLVAG